MTDLKIVGWASAAALVLGELGGSEAAHVDSGELVGLRSESRLVDRATGIEYWQHNRAPLVRRDGLVEHCRNKFAKLSAERWRGPRALRAHSGATSMRQFDVYLRTHKKFFERPTPDGHAAVTSGHHLLGERAPDPIGGVGDDYDLAMDHGPRAEMLSSAV